VGYGSMTWKLVNRSYLYEAATPDEVSFVVDSLELPNGREREYYFVDCPYHVVAVVAVNSRNEVAMIRQHRYLVDEVLLEVPCGSPEGDETLVDGASKELREEAGVTAESFKNLGTFYTSVGITNQKVTAFLATGVSLVDQELDDGEEIEVEWMPFGHVISLIKSGQVTNGTSAIALMMAWLHSS
jgi:8-oxo-dGTP pyrophosphatase MutT (NUDIX family)